MKKFQKILNISAEIINSVNISSAEADIFLNDFFRKNTFLGSNERKIISEIVFFYFRNKNLLDYIFKSFDCLLKNENNLYLNTSQQNTTKTNIICFFMTKYNASNTNLQNFEALANKYFKEFEIKDAINSIFLENCVNISTQFLYNFFDSELNKINYIDYDIPDKVFFEKLALKYSFSEEILYYLNSNPFEKRSKESLMKLSESSIRSADMIIRINKPVENFEYVCNFLKENNIEFNKCELTPYALSIKNRINIGILDIYKNGIVEIQDEGSQIISYILNPKNNSQILDACAGAGGKSLHLADLTSNSSKITASDIHRTKLDKLKLRADKCGLTNIRLQTIEPYEKNPKLHKSFYDYVLVDSPCSGFGTFRRKPQKKYMLTMKEVHNFSKTELKVLKYFSQFVKTNGILLYATCSILPKENQEVIKNFLELHPNFEPVPIKDRLQKNHIEIPSLGKDDFQLTLSPEVFDTDGFFIALLRKTR